MIADKVMMLESCKYNDLAKYTKVFNTNQIEYHLWIYMDPEDAKDAVFLEAHEVQDNDSKVSDGVFERQSQCWIRVVTEHINTSAGKHTYKLMMVDRYTDTDFSLYVSYYIQDDNPDKPYVYMKDKEDQEDEPDEPDVPEVSSIEENDDVDDQT